MKKLSNTLQLSKQSVQILDDRALLDVRGGADFAKSCECDSCNPSCDYRSCNNNAV